MINQTEVTIRLQHVSQGWFLWGEDDSGTPLSVTSWKRNAFTWHSTSFYGTFLKEATFEGKQGVLLTNAQAFEYIANKPMNSFAHIQLNGPITALTKDANELWDAFTSGSFVPDIEHWPKQPSWKVQNTPIEDDTLASLFSAAVNESILQDNRSNDGWEDAKRLYEHYDFTKRQLETALHEEDWL